MTRSRPRSGPRWPPEQAPPPELCFRAMALPSGALLPIEVRLGRRLLRTIDPHSEEGRRLLASGRVDVFSPGDAPREPNPPPTDH